MHHPGYLKYTSFLNVQPEHTTRTFYTTKGRRIVHEFPICDALLVQKLQHAAQLSNFSVNYLLKMAIVNIHVHQIMNK